MTKAESTRPSPRTPRGLRDLFADDVAARRKMIDTILGVYELYGFAALETPALEYVEVLGKFLPESDTPAGGVFSLRDDDGQWLAMRYDLTAPLSRVFSRYGSGLPKPYRRYQVGPVWRQEKPGPGRFREFFQCDFDTVGTASVAADAEICAVAASCFEALGIGRGDYIVRVNNRKVANGILDVIALPEADGSAPAGARLSVLRAIDKLDRVGPVGVSELLMGGRKDPSGDFTPGAGLSKDQADVVLGYLQASSDDRSKVCQRLRELVGKSAVGQEGVRELEEIHEYLESMDLGADQVIFDPSVVRGLAYYTGPVFEAELTFEIEEEGAKRPVGSVLGGGRYDNLVKRFTGTDVPATGASIGVDRLLTALQALRSAGSEGPQGPVVVTVFDKDRGIEYQRMVTELRNAGIAAELYLGSSGFRAQLKYANKRAAPVVVIAGSDEFERGEVTLKDMRLGMKLSKTIRDRDAWSKEQPAQVSAPRGELVAATRQMLERQAGSGDD